MSDDNDITSYWELVRKKSPIKLVSNRSSDLGSQLDLACEKTIFDFKQKFGKQELPELILKELIPEMVRRFLSHWSDSLRQQDLAGLIEIVLEGQGLSHTDLKSFLRSLPDRFIMRICESAIHSQSTTGVYAVIGIESAFRAGKVDDYTIGDLHGKFYVECVDRRTDAQLKFFLDDPIQIT